MIVDISEKELQIMLDENSSYSEILLKIGYKSNSGYLTKLLGEKAKNLDKTKFNKNRYNKLKNRLKRESDSLFVENGRYTDRTVVRRRFIETIEYKCNVCHLSSWNNSNISLELDHINGINTDNRLDNLRLLCPNCHSQTTTYSGRNILKEKPIYYCNCGNVKCKTSPQCKKCSSKSMAKIKWPAIEHMAKLVWEKPTTEISKDLGVSDASIAKFCKKNNISKPGRGHWKPGV